MTSRERLLCALNRVMPDRLPVSLHQWQRYHLDTYLGGITDLEAFAYFGLDAQIQFDQPMGQYYLAPDQYVEFSTPEWVDEVEVVRDDQDYRVLHHTVRTPKDELTYKTAADRKTVWVTEHLIKHDEDIELIRDYMPVFPLDAAPVAAKRDEIGDKGILRGTIWGDQAGCWQHACCLMDINELILKCFDDPKWVHDLLGILLEKKLRYIESMPGAAFDLIETGGGAGSATVISPDLHERFCLPYDRALHVALHDLGFKITYHTCGGTIGIEELIVANGCDASETLAPPSVGGDQEPWEFKAKVGDKLALIGGVDQFNICTTGTDADIRQKVCELFAKVGGGGGYICSLSDHFFDANPDKLRCFAEAARDCVYI